MTAPPLADLYRGYIDCLNRRDLGTLGRHVAGDVHYNGEPVGLAGYRAMLEEDFRAIPDLRFEIALLVAEAPHVAARLRFDCTPAGTLFGYPVDGRRVRFGENVFYRFGDGLIREVHSVIDRMAVGAQL
ncbi:ester cyclase [Poseidonocella sp. HB161398]|uniref:ester cyclase n=1 Tax=Poseidonocella sp. HB161398 TaxID=2320855 RepID=UPI0011097B9B|nr:ester cyclase [Poseidonocella sp. HB161398]